VLAEESIALSEGEYYARYLGFDDVGAFRAVAADRGTTWTEGAIGDLMQRKAARLERLEREASVLFPGAAESIQRLAASGPLAVASGALRAEVTRVLDREALTPYFRAIVTAEDTAASKPAPDPYLHAVALLAAAIGAELHPSECVAVEDSRWGLQSARAAGLRTVGVTHTYPAETLQDADLVIASLDALTWEGLTELIRTSAS
jgi:HAD superfamily hydrolase (TIGR01509 family)